MMPTIGIMIGMYILAGVLEMIANPDLHVMVRIFSGISALVAAMGVADLISGATTQPDTPSFYQGRRYVMKRHRCATRLREPSFQPAALLFGTIPSDTPMPLSSISQTRRGSKRRHTSR
jgi:hypothetical protein